MSAEPLPGPAERVGAVILAAGASTRMGRPKALVQWRGRPFVAHSIALAAAARCEPIVVVVGAVALGPAATHGATVVVHEGWRRGQMSSLRVGLGALGRGHAALMLTVDRPHVRAQTVAAVVDAWREQPEFVWQPLLHGRRGHPVLVPADVVARVLDAPETATLRDVLAQDGVALRRRGLPCTDAAVRENLDRPEDLALLPT